MGLVSETHLVLPRKPPAAASSPAGAAAREEAPQPPEEVLVREDWYGVANYGVRRSFFRIASGGARSEHTGCNVLVGSVFVSGASSHTRKRSSLHLIGPRAERYEISAMDILATGVAHLAHTLVVQEVAERQLLLLRFLRCCSRTMSAILHFFCPSPQTSSAHSLCACGVPAVCD